MSTPTRIAGFLAGLAAAFAAALAVGAQVGPVGEPPGDHAQAEVGGSPHAGGQQDEDQQDGAPHEEPAATGPAALPGGLAVAQDGYRLDLASSTAAAGADRTLELVVTGPDGDPVTDFEVEHEKELHLVVVRRDLTGFQHVHPVRAADGTWSVDVDLVPGQWRVLADFVASGGPALTLGADLSVAGEVPAAAELPESRTVEVDGYTVEVEGGLRPGTTSDLTFTVTRDGRPVTDLEPYLGASGHLVALREGDLAYLHVHPGAEPGGSGAGPRIGFAAEVPSAGRYHLFLDFRHDGVVRTAQLALDSEEES